MAKTKIEWAQHSWNPIRGCRRVSPGCENCYAERMAARFSGPGQAYEGLAEMTPSGPRWTGNVRIVDHKLDEPLRRRKPTTYFVNSMSDLFHEDVPDEFIDRVFAGMAIAQEHTFQVLTKRPGRMRRYLTDEARLGEIIVYMSDEFGWLSPDDAACIAPAGIPSAFPQWPAWPLPNVWLGVSVEDQEAAEARIPSLLDTPAAVRFVSCEPLLGPLDLGYVAVDYNGTGIEYVDVLHFDGNVEDDTRWHGTTLDWVIVGGESGPGARPMHPDWVRSLRDQCQAAGVPFFFKQWGAWEPSETTASDTAYHKVSDGEIAAYKPGSQRHWWGGRDGDGKPLSVRVGKKVSGRMLDDRTWDEMPA